MRRLALLILLTMTASGCSERSHPGADGKTGNALRRDTESQSTLPTEVPHAVGDIFRGQFSIGATQVSYAAYFVEDALMQISETRESAGITQTGEYEFQGARLMHYVGEAQDIGRVNLQFDLQGALIDRADTALSDEQIAAVVQHAQLLRSHALAQRTSSNHLSRM